MLFILDKFKIFVDNIQHFNFCVFQSTPKAFPRLLRKSADGVLQAVKYGGNSGGPDL
jgi:hypothetical protein